MLKQASLIVHHGGIGTTEAALASGRPQLLLTRHLEQNLTGGALTKMGVGLVVPGNFKKEDVVEAVHKIVDDPTYRDNALALAEDIQKRGYGDNVQRIVEGCERIISFGRAEPLV